VWCFLDNDNEEKVVFLPFFLQFIVKQTILIGEKNYSLCFYAARWGTGKMKTV
jgi:hypothetical protein